MTKQKKSFLDRMISPDEKEKTQEGKRVDLEEDKSNSVEDVVSEIEAIKKIEKEDNNKKTANTESDLKENNLEEKWSSNDDSEKEGGEDEEGQLTIDVYQSDDLIIVKSIIGGARPDDLDISITNDMVAIKGTRKNPDAVQTEDYYYQECFWGKFSRSVILPCDIKTDEVKATMKNGILTIKLPKIEKNSSMKIKVEEE